MDGHETGEAGGRHDSHDARSAKRDDGPEQAGTGDRAGLVRLAHRSAADPGIRTRLLRTAAPPHPAPGVPLLRRAPLAGRPRHRAGHPRGQSSRRQADPGRGRRRPPRVHERRRQGPAARGREAFRRRRDRHLQPAPHARADARAAVRRARTALLVAGPDQRLSDAARRAGIRPALGHPRRVRVADQRHQALVDLRHQGEAAPPRPALRARHASRRRQPTSSSSDRAAPSTFRAV